MVQDKREEITRIDQERKAVTTVFDSVSISDKEWDALIKELDREYQLSFDGSLKDSIGGYFRGIDEGVNLQSDKYRDGSLVEVKAEDFRHFHVETLLDQAANLLERGISVRAEWDEYSVRAFDLILDLIEYSELEKIHEKEEKAGYYEWMAAHAASEAAAERQTAEGIDNLLVVLKKLIKYRQDKEKELIEVVKRAAHLSHFPSYKYDQPEFKHADIRRDDKNGIVTNETVKYEYPDGSGKFYTPHESSETAAGEQTAFNLQVQANELESEEAGLTSAKKIAESRKNAAEIRAAWEAANKEFARERTKLIIQLQRRRAAAAETAGGPLNYTERMEPLMNRFERDFREATERMTTAARGLREIYGYDVPLPSNPFPPAMTVTPRKFYDDCLTWVRNAVSFVIRFTQLEQNYIHPVSIRNVIGDTAWTVGRGKRQWSITLTENMFKAVYGEEQFHVRLRGLSAFVFHHDPNSVWQLKVTPPRASLSRHLPGLPGNTTPVQLNQKDVPGCRFGRANGRDYPRDPDVVGISSLHNVGPFGEWVITINERDFLGHSVEEIQDIHLDLHLAFRS